MHDIATGGQILWETEPQAEREYLHDDRDIGGQRLIGDIGIGEQRL